MYLVTGGAGFIGSMLIKALNEQGIEDIIIVDRLGNGGKWGNLRHCSFAQYLHADDLFTFLPSLSPIRAIFHLGACSSTTERNVDYLMKNNLEFSQRLFTWASEQQVPLIYASSAATYGDGKNGYSDNHQLLSHLVPLNPYGFSKHLFDRWVLKQSKTPPYWFGLKFFNVYGPQEAHKGSMRSVVLQAFEQISTVGRLQLFKSYLPAYLDGEQQRDFIYVADVARAMIELLLINDPLLSGIYNLGTGQARSFNELAVACFRAAGRPIQIDYIEMPIHLQKQYQYFTQAQMEKWRRLLPNFHFTSLEDAVVDYFHYFSTL